MAISKNGSMGNQTPPSYNLPKGNAIIKDRQEQYNYIKYREKYKDAVGVFPEFDLINNPVCGVIFDNIIYPDDLDKAMKDNNKKGILQIFTTGIRSGLYALDYGKAPSKKSVSYVADRISDDTGNLMSITFGNSRRLYPPFKKDFKSVMEKYKFLYSALSCVDTDSIVDMEPCECFASSSLGYRKLENGMYAEGTWKDGKFVYGFVYHPQSGLVAGTFKDEKLIEGVWLNFDGVWDIGQFNDEGSLHCKNGVRIYTQSEDPNSDMLFLIQTGNFTNSMENGYMWEFLLSKGNAVDMSDTKYDFGQEVKMSFFEKRRRKKLYGSTAFERIVGFYQALACIVVAVFLFSVVIKGSIGTIGVLAMLFFAIFGIKRFVWSVKEIKKARQFKA